MHADGQVVDQMGAQTALKGKHQDGCSTAMKTLKGVVGRVRAVVAPRCSVVSGPAGSR